MYLHPCIALDDGLDEVTKQRCEENENLQFANEGGLIIQRGLIIHGREDSSSMGERTHHPWERGLCHPWREDSSSMGGGLVIHDSSSMKSTVKIHSVKSNLIKMIVEVSISRSLTHPKASCSQRVGWPQGQP